MLNSRDDEDHGGLFGDGSGHIGSSDGSVDSDGVHGPVAAATLRHRFLMNFVAGTPLSLATTVTEGSSSLSLSFDQDALYHMNLSSREMESAPYPIREGQPDCSYYMRTGLCRFGETCRFNHPPNRRLAIATARMKGEYPERVGQPECQYYLKTGTCKFGATCVFHHPKDRAGVVGRVSLNVLGYPFRPDEVECAYYLRTGQCKFGSTCKFHHPQPTTMEASLGSSSIYTAQHSLTTTDQQSYSGERANWPLSRTSFIASPRWQGTSSYTPLILPQRVVFAYSGQMGSASSPESHKQLSGTSQLFTTSSSRDAANIGSQRTYTSYRSGSLPLSYYALQSDNAFPERPGQPECQFYMKTGDCKFGAVCRFHHPRERLVPPPDCVLSSIGLPLRPGEPLCIFYSQYGICKFGPSCKFDHPMGGGFTYNFSASSSAGTPIVQHLLKSSSGPEPLTSSSEGFDVSSVKPRRVSLSEGRQIGSGDSSIDAKG